MPPATAVPHSPTDCRTRGTMSVLVCRANPKAWELRAFFRASRHSTLRLRGKERRPTTPWHIHLGVSCCRHLVLRAPLGPCRYHRAHIEVRGIRPRRSLCASFPFRPLSRCGSCPPDATACVPWDLFHLCYCRATLDCCLRAHRAELFCCRRRKWCHTAAGLVKMDLPFTPAVVPAPNRTGDRHLLVMLTRRIDSQPAALPWRLAVSRINRSFSCNDISAPTNLIYGSKEEVSVPLGPGPNAARPCAALYSVFSTLAPAPVHCASPPTPAKVRKGGGTEATLTVPPT